MALIDLDFSLKAIEEYKLCQCKSKYTTENECLAARHGMDLAKMVLHNVPTVEAKPVVHAHWECTQWYEHQCSNCGDFALLNDKNVDCKSNYCPHCGAVMDEVIDNDKRRKKA